VITVSRFFTASFLHTSSHMKAIVTRQYGGPEVLEFEDYPDPVAGAGEVLVRVAAASVNPIDILMRSGAAKDFAPIKFPGVIGVDISGTVWATGPGVEGFSIGDKVFAMADHTYAELCAVKAASLAKIPQGLDLVAAAALPLATTTGSQSITEGTGIRAGQTVLISGASGNVGRSAVFAAKSRGAMVIAAVKRSQLQAAALIGADQVIATDDENAMARLPMVDAVADTVGGNLALVLLGKIKKGGVFASLVGAPENTREFPSIKIVSVFSHADPKTLLFMADAVMKGRLSIPISAKLPMKDASKAHALVAKGNAGKVLLVVDDVK
jgi:NADPH:quinone reductase-like Zn-dependent oxidoreductase